MCLKITSKKPKIAKTRIFVHKYIAKGGKGLYHDLTDENNNFMPWVKGFEYEELGKVSIFRDLFGNYYNLHEGALHTNKGKRPNNYREYSELTGGYAEMYIPKGTKYWENEKTGEIASKKLVWI